MRLYVYYQVWEKVNDGKPLKHGNGVVWLNDRYDVSAVDVAEAVRAKLPAALGQPFPAERYDIVIPFLTALPL